MPSSVLDCLPLAASQLSLANMAATRPQHPAQERYVLHNSTRNADLSFLRSSAGPGGPSPQCLPPQCLQKGKVDFTVEFWSALLSRGGCKGCCNSHVCNRKPDDSEYLIVKDS